MSFHLNGEEILFYFLSLQNTNSRFLLLDFFCSYLVANLQMKVTWFGVKSQVDSVSIVTDDVFGSRVLAVASSHQLLQSIKKVIRVN